MNRHMRTHPEHNLGGKQAGKPAGKRAREEDASDSPRRPSAKRQKTNGANRYNGELSVGLDHRLLGQCKEEVKEEVKEEEEFHCPICMKLLKSKAELEEHMDSHPDEPAQCMFCGKRELRGKLYIHYLLAHKQPPTPPRIPSGFHDMSFMDFCAEKFAHVATALCEKNRRRPNGAADHQYMCPTCHYAFPTATSLQLHMETRHSNITIGDSADSSTTMASESISAECKHCGTTYLSAGEAVCHVTMLCPATRHTAVDHYTTASNQKISQKLANSDSEKSEKENGAEMREKSQISQNGDDYSQNNGSCEDVEDKENQEPHPSDMVPQADFLLAMGLCPKPLSAAATAAAAHRQHADKLVVRDGLDLSLAPATNTPSSKKKSPRQSNGISASKKQFTHRMPSAMYKHTELRIPKPPLSTRPNQPTTNGHTGEEDDDLVIVEAPENNNNGVVSRGPWKCNFCPEVFKVYSAYQGNYPVLTSLHVFLLFGNQSICISKNT
jgi:hypothetical protein